MEKARLVGRNSFGLVSLLALALLFLVVPVWHAVTHYPPTMQTIPAIAIPVVLVSFLLVGIGWLTTKPRTEGESERIFVWATLGTTAMAAFGALLALSLSLEGTPLTEPIVFVANTAIVGSLLGFAVGTYDARARIHARRRIESNERFWHIFEHSRDAMVLANNDGEYVECNPAATDLFGVPEPALLGKRIEDFAVDGFDFDAAWTQFLEEGDQHGQFRLFRPDDQVRIVEFAATADVMPEYHLSTLRDVTERVRYQRELADSREALGFLNHMLRHNVLNAMQVVLANLDTLQSDLDETTDRSESADVDAIQRRSEDVVSLVNRVKRFSDAMCRDRVMECISLTTVLRDATETVQETHPHATIIADIPDSVSVLADPLLSDVFENLLDNAVIHNDTDTPEVDVSVDVDETVRVQVTDDGPGVSDDVKQFVFSRGHSGHQTTGAGFGLYIVETLVERYDGTVWVDDNHPKGAVFTVELERAPTDSGL
jgi:PAS domain S-box-containing protein